MRKIVAMSLTVLLIIAAFSLPVSAVTLIEDAPNACTHRWVYDDRYINGPHGGDKNGCIMHMVVIERCERCGSIRERVDSTHHVKHSYVVIRSVHNGPKKQHTYDSRCTKCQYFTSGTVTCYGPPCPEPY